MHRFYAKKNSHLHNDTRRKLDSIFYAQLRIVRIKTIHIHVLQKAQTCNMKFGEFTNIYTVHVIQERKARW